MFKSSSRTLFAWWMVLVALMLPVEGLAQTPCTRSTKVEDFREAQVQAEDAFAQGDEAALHTARDAAVQALRCLGERLPSEEAAAFHRMIAMVAFSFGDEARVKGELQRAIRLDPEYYDTGNVTEEDHRFIQLYAEAVQMADPPMEVLQPPPGGFVNVDGVREAGRPMGVACVVQVFNADYMLVDTLYLPPGIASPSWGRSATPLVDDSFEDDGPSPPPTGDPATAPTATAPAAAEPGGGSTLLWLILGVVGGIVVGIFLCCCLSFILYYSYY